ncbi:oligosaccharide flippase family protein [Chryseobacterium carnipullorum]|uniref:oligosaccharide flippase family protein n=1 Tax=Chryseobacterium carnipullorum TaxID=1124835 RepID=UPI0023F5610F|nr:oligosaccharide flippase family protein [Chryseobacterium carnipullorum]
MKIFNHINRYLSSDINKKIATSSFWILTGNIISKGTLLVATILMARFLSKEEYGQFGIIKSTILMFAMFAGMELGITATKYISQYKKTDKLKVQKIVGLSNLIAIIISIILSIAIYCFAKPIAEQISAPNLYVEIRISAFILFFSSINGIQTGILNGMEMFKEASFINVFAGIISSILLIISSIYFGLKGVVFAFGSNFIILFVFNFYVLKRSFYKDFDIKILSKDNFDEISVIWKFSLPAIFAGLMVGPVTWLCNYLLVNQLNGYKEMANFDIANQWRNTILFIPVALSQIALPLLSSSINDKEQYGMIFKKNLKLNLYIASVFVIFFIIITPVIVWFYGENYNDIKIPLIIMFITTGFIAINNVIGQAIASQGKMWIGFFVNFLWAGVLIGLSYLFIVIFNMGASGISLAYLISYIFHTVVQFLYIKRFI